MPARQLRHRDGDRQAWQHRDQARQRRRRHREVDAATRQLRHQGRRHEGARQLEDVRRDREAPERERQQADEQPDAHADRDVGRAAAEELTAGRRDDAVADDAKPPGIGGLLRPDLGDPPRPVAWLDGAGHHLVRHAIEGGEPPQIQLARLDANQKRALAIERAKRGRDRRRRREELPDEPQLIADTLQDVLEAVGRVARRVQRLRQPQHEHVALVGGGCGSAWPKCIRESCSRRPGASVPVPAWSMCRLPAPALGTGSAPH